MQVCGRSAEGIRCSIATGLELGTTITATDAFGGTDGWDAMHRYLTLLPADVNGDGTDDLCGLEPEGIRCALGLGDGRFQNANGARRWLDRFTEGEGFHLHPSRWATLQYADLDGDGDEDVCARTREGFSCALSNGADGFAELTVWSTEMEDGSGWEEHNDYWSTLQLADVDGDGRADLCGRRWDGLWCGLSNGSTGFTNPWVQSHFSEVQGWTYDFYFGTIRFPDVDGDGDRDVCARSALGVACLAVQGGRFEPFGPMEFVWASHFADNHWYDPEQWGSVAFPDVTGDGLADVCGLDVDGYYCGPSLVGLFAPVSRWQAEIAETNGFEDPARWGTIMHPDLDGDGAADVCVRQPEGLACALSNGRDGFGALAQTTRFADAQGWGTEARWRTLHFMNVSSQACSRSSASRVPWRTNGLPPRVDP